MTKGEGNAADGLFSATCYVPPSLTRRYAALSGDIPGDLGARSNQGFVKKAEMSFGQPDQYLGGAVSLLNSFTQLLGHVDAL
jgi:hypothetical protein